jgi:hypothetical protein
MKEQQWRAGSSQRAIVTLSSMSVMPRQVQR